MNQILNQEEIDIIARESQNPILRHPSIMMVSSSNPLSIFKITTKGLIFINGNNETGLNHIFSRHQFDSNNVNWFKTKEGFDRVENPSRFSIGSGCAVYFFQIVEDIYLEENKSKSNNERFDKYEGISSIVDNIPVKYVLILYRDTKIIHTLFPKTKRNNIRKQVLNYRRNDPKAKRTSLKDIYASCFEYLDIEDIVRYKIHLILNNNTHFLNTWVQVNSLKGTPLYSQNVANKKLNKRITFEDYIKQLGFINLSKVEQKIKLFDEKLNN